MESGSAWPFRRAIDVVWEAEKGSGDELAEAVFYTAGHHNPDGGDLRIATAEGKPVASRVLMVGPGDRVRVVFSLAHGQRKYYVYFGNPKPPLPSLPAKGLDDVNYRCGLLMDMHQWTGGPADNFKQVEDAWAKAGPVIGRTMVERPFIGYNPFGEQQTTIAKYTGSLFAPVDGEYIFAVSADDKGALYLDGKPLVFAPNMTGDTRYRATLSLKRGRHDFVFYHINFGGDGRFTVAWKRPDMSNFDAINKEAFGLLGKSSVGALEEIKKTFSADFKLEYLGECFYADHYSHRYRLVAQHGQITAPARFDWDFGDGQVARDSADVAHVYLTEGVYPVKISMTVGGVGTNADVQTTQIVVTRDYSQLEHPPLDEPAKQSGVVASYDVEKMPAAWLQWATWLHLRAGKYDAMFAAASRMARLPQHADPRGATTAMQEATREAVGHGRIEQALKMWDAVPKQSDLQPAAVLQEGNLLLYRTADFDAAVKVLEPFTSANDASVKRMYGQALVLNQKPAEGRKVLEALPVQGGQGRPEQQGALSGAMARTVEGYIQEGDWETGEEQWERWQAAYPADFLDGYSVMLKTRLIELKKAPEPPLAAAKVAEAFALAVPKSSYAPQLLDRASKLLAKSDPEKSQALRETLKKKYPEDPLSQEGK